jgi:hypothetical protein
MEGVFGGMMFIDYRQTSDLHNHPYLYEHNCFLGQHPKQAKINAWFIGASVGHVWIADKLHGKWRSLWQTVWIGTEGFTVERNKVVVGMHFSF